MTTVPVQLPLFKDLPIPPRPKRFSENVLEETVDLMMPSVMKWFGSSEDEEEIRDNIKQVLEFEDDSYQIAKELEDNLYWSVDRELINVLDEVKWRRDEAHKGVVYAWVVQNCVTPKLTLEQKVQFRHKGRILEGIVTKIYESEAKYLVFSEELGHIRSGVGVHGIVLPYEEVDEVMHKATEL
jgi:hypothetical protein